MVFRILLRFLANNENLINKLAESRPFRRAAQFVVYIVSRTNLMHGTRSLPSNPAEFADKLKNIVREFSANVRKEVQDAKDKIKKT